MVMVMMDLYLQKSPPQKMASILPSSVLIAPGGASSIVIVTTATIAMTATSVVAGTAFVIAHGLGRPAGSWWGWNQGLLSFNHAVERTNLRMWVSKAFGYVILYDYIMLCTDPVEWYNFVKRDLSQFILQSPLGTLL